MHLYARKNIKCAQDEMYASFCITQHLLCIKLQKCLSLLNLSFVARWTKTHTSQKNRWLGGVNMQLNESYGVVSLMLVSSRARKIIIIISKGIYFSFRKILRKLIRGVL